VTLAVLTLSDHPRSLPNLNLEKSRGEGRRSLECFKVVGAECLHNVLNAVVGADPVETVVRHFDPAPVPR
jgi:hypothetical protein